MDVDVIVPTEDVQLEDEEDEINLLHILGHIKGPAYRIDEGLRVEKVLKVRPSCDVHHAILVQVDLETGGYPFDATFTLDVNILEEEGNALPQVGATRATAVQAVGTVLLSGTPFP